MPAVGEFDRLASRASEAGDGDRGLACLGDDGGPRGGRAELLAGGVGDGLEVGRGEGGHEGSLEVSV